MEKPPIRIINQSTFNLYLMQNTVANVIILFISLLLQLLAKQSIKLKLIFLVLKLFYRKIFISIYCTEITIFKYKNHHGLYLRCYIQPVPYRRPTKRSWALLTAVRLHFLQTLTR